MKFQFNSRKVSNVIDQDTKIECLEPALDGSKDWIFLTSDFEVIRFFSERSSTQVLFKIDKDLVPRAKELSMVLDRELEYIAVTGRSKGKKGEGDYNWGHVFELDSGKALFKLECGDYYPHMAPFPVAFLRKDKKTLLIHATDWDELDVTDLQSKKCLTERDLEHLPDNPDYGKDGQTEWSGTLLLSPNQEWIATIGWAWHPVGRAFSWNLDDWVTKNIWEADNGSSKQIYTCWPYFWDGPFCWIDNKRLCIWGHDGGPTDDQGFPMPSAAVYNVESGELIKWFEGPTIDLFYFDEYLFSGGKAAEDLTIWDVNTGDCIFSDQVFEQFPRHYHPRAKEFWSQSENGDITLTSWSKVSSE